MARSIARPRPIKYVMAGVMMASPLAAVVLAFLLTITAVQTAQGQKPSSNLRPQELVQADSLLDLIAANRVLQISLVDSLYQTYASYHDSCGMARASAARCFVLDQQGQLEQAYLAGQQAEGYFVSSCDSSIWYYIVIQRSSVEISLGNFQAAIDMCEQELMRPSKALKFAKWYALQTNVAIARFYNQQPDEALVAFNELYVQAVMQEGQNNIKDASANLSAIYGFLADGDARSAYMDSVDKYQLIALNIAREQGDLNLARLYFNRASFWRDRQVYRTSLTYLDSSEVIATLNNQLELMMKNTLMRSANHEELGELERANWYLKQYIALRDSLLSVEKMKTIADLQEKYESEKKAGQIKELTIANLDIALKEEQAIRARNIFVFVVIGVLIIAMALYSRLRFTRRAKAAIEREKEVSETLLLNILPYETAQELKEKGSAEAKLMDNVTVLFTDFKGFTAMSEQLSPKELVNDLHECFSAFDELMEKYGIEKIKTIGDAYMAAGGLPIPNTSHARDVVMAALEMAKVVEAGKAKKIAAGQPYFEVRIGVHTGPVVAGIVGVKKFQYDIWGDTVNTASRMESSGAVGRVNVSQTTYEILNSDPQFTFESRGKISAKGKGEIDMYFVH